ncbi:putative Histone-lysine N-methyltransferase, H3 lysine-36 specific [Glarea lozoyensis 74030]|uniref:Histone-lysine N-methyltransferase, H3 lysine-36 specific n=1 Tax=Glarea lozoyensis (strain ATCC 74030 / MF5533) TaxID=1104152 RepID=H0EJU8_GLAL7|nr:putative Histone-lysine N-methyltransferase, H3 lysine-36 specific [Glarea lozoyensis 74030]
MESERISTALSDDEMEEVDGDENTVSVEPEKIPKTSRKSAPKVASRPPILYNDLEDVVEEAVTKFDLLQQCRYGSKKLGASNSDPWDCDCPEEWIDGVNNAYKCKCGDTCQNQRFQRQDYADVSVIKTDKKGYGLRANTDLDAGDFVFEYIGEVINEPTFRKRTIEYHKEGIKHFYFMSLGKDEFVDATKKGNLGRFCNHSCNPNCFVDKWIVKDKLRMGIFAQRPIQKGEELVFNYNVDRYGADPQPCYCGEPNCGGFMGGKTQTDREIDLPTATLEALGIEDGNGWGPAAAKKPRKKRSGESDEEYINSLPAQELDEDGVRTLMATLMQCKEKWLAVRLITRLQRCDDDRVRNRVVQMHGYQILRTTLNTWEEDNDIILRILDILYRFPRLTRNKISDSKIESAVATLVNSEHEDVAYESKRLIEAWSKLEVAYRIPRKKHDPNAVDTYERRPSEREEEVAKKPVKPFVAPTGPKNNTPQKAFFPSRAPPPRRNFPLTLPRGWFEAKDKSGNTYFYTQAGTVTWHRPTLAAVEPPQPKAIPKSVQTARTLQDIIQSITAEQSSQTPTQSATAESTPKESKKPVEKWRSYPEEKQMKLYENTLLPHIKYVMAKFAKYLPKEDLKKFGKEVGKLLVKSDFKHKRVEDPTKITEKQEKKVKSFVRDYFEKVLKKRTAIDQKKKEKLANATPLESPSRKRTHDEINTPDSESNKRLKEGESDAVPTPPPPPPPPEPEETEETEEERELRLQEEELMRENEEAELLDKDGEIGDAVLPSGDVDVEAAELVRRNKQEFEANQGVDVGANGVYIDGDGMEGLEGPDLSNGTANAKGRSEEVMSH